MSSKINFNMLSQLFRLTPSDEAAVTKLHALALGGLSFFVRGVLPPLELNRSQGQGEG